LLIGAHLTVLPSYGIGALGADSNRYLTGAARLLAHEPLEGLQRWYAGYAAIIAVCQSAGWGLGGVVLLQLVAAAVAVVALYGLGRALGDSRTGVVAAPLFAVNPDVARWNLFVLTDAFYISLFPVLALAIWKGREGSASWLLLALTTLACLALLRPSGWLLLPVAAVFWIRQARLNRVLKRAAVAGALCAFGAWALTSTAGATAGREPHLLLGRGEVIWGYTAARLVMPEPPASRREVWQATIVYVAAHPLASAHLAVTRVSWELAHGRPFYSPLHNAACLLLLPVHALALWGLRQTWRHPLTGSLVMLVASQVLPGESRRTVQELLRSLRNEGLIHLVGRTRAGRWHGTSAAREGSGR
jgi:4-amino-4-deoxy-L-arabinose transferase-like glycosyltransferase